MTAPASLVSDEATPPRPLLGVRRKIAFGGAWNTVAWLVTNACGVINTILLVRSMNHSQYGLLVMATSTMGIIAPVAGFGLSQALVQLSPRVGPDGARLVLRYVLRVSSVIAAIVALVTGVACLVMGLDRFQAFAATLAILIPIAMVSPFTSSFSGFLQSIHHPKRLTKALLVAPLLLSSFVITLCLVTHPSAMWVALARTGSVLVGFACLLVAVRRSGGLSVGSAAHMGRTELSVHRVLSLGGSLLTGTVTAILLAQLDVLILGFTHGRASVAFYGPASQVADNALTMAATVGTFYLPSIAAVLARGDLSQAGDLYRWASRWAFVWVAPVVAVMFACPASVLTLLFRSDYARMATPLRILAAGVLVNVLFGFNGNTVDSLNKVRIIITRQMIALGFNVTICIILIPHLGANGAAIATSSSLFVMNAVGSSLLYWQTKITPVNFKLLAVALALGVSVAFGIGANRLPLVSAARVVLVGAVTAVLCILVSYLVSGQPERRSIRTGMAHRYERLRGTPAPSDRQPVGGQ